MAPENKDLERRVLAHEQILQALLAHLSKRDPELVKSLTGAFSASRRGAHEHNDTETADYAEVFMHEVSKLRLQMNITRAAPERKGAQEAAFDRQPLSRLDGPVLIRGEKLGDIWHVTRDGAFVGDYLGAEEAMQATVALALEVERRGGTAEVVFGDTVVAV